MAGTAKWNVSSSGVRDRVEELIAKSDRRIARKLIDEHIVEPAAGEFSELTKAQQAGFVETVRRTVNNHRRALRKTWKETPLPKPGDREAANEFIAHCRSRIEDLEAIAAGGGSTKTTAQVNALAEIRQLETLIGAVKNVDVAGRRLNRLVDMGEGDEEQNPLPFMGLVVDWKRVPVEEKEKLLAGNRGDKRRRAGAAKDS